MKENLDWSKDSVSGLIPAIIQQESTQDVLMLGYMNEESFQQTLRTGLVTFFSRSKNKLWVKGETSGNFLKLKSWKMDCDRDTLLFQVEAQGPACHTGDDTCFGPAPSKTSLHFLGELEAIINERWAQATNTNEKSTDLAASKSYVATLASQGLDRIAQKVGEEAIETVIAAKNNDAEDFKGEAADLIFHLMVLLKQKGISLNEVATVLAGRNKKLRS